MAQAHYQILFLEDSPVDRVLYSRFLRQDTLATYEITEAKSGLEGLTKLAESQPDLILLDYQLQDMNGLEFLNQLQLQLSSTQIPVIILTGIRDEKIAVQAMENGVQDYIVKDKITPQGLCRAIHEVLEKIRMMKNMQTLYIPIEQAELYRNLRKLNASLEKKVQKLTEELAVSESKYRAIFNQKFQFTGLLDLEGMVLELNQAALKFTGLQLAEVVNCPIWEIYCWQISQATQDQLKQAIARAAQGEFISYEVEVQGIDNQILTIDFSIGPLRNNAGEVVMLISEGRDVTEAKLNEAKWKQAEATLKFQAQILEEIHDAVITTDINGIIQSWNIGAENYYGYTAAEMIGQSVSILYVDPVELQTNIMSTLLAKGRHEVEVAACRAKSGDIVYINLRLSVIRDNHGNITHIVGCSHDITKQQVAIKERNDILKQEQAARKQVEAANRIKDEFLAVVSHELRTPLNSILGWASLLKKGKLKPEETDEALSIIERNAKLQVYLINDLLDMSRIFQGKVTMKVSSVNLATIISAVSETLFLAPKTKKIQIQTIIEANIGPVAGDPVRLQQILWNLLSNAVKFTPHGGQIEVRLECVGFDAQITVSDTGKGISSEFLPYIFDYFRQEDSSTTREFGGLGLGLAIARNLAELHGGTIQAESSGLGQGATFTFRLPLMNANSENADYPQPQDGYLA